MRVVSISMGAGAARCTNGLRVRKRIGGSSISPARCSISNRPRQTMSRKAPLACLHSQASQSFADNRRRLARGFSAINWRINAMSSLVTTRPRYVQLVSDNLPSVWQSPKRNASVFCDFSGQTFKGRHAGGASVSGLPAASSNCAWCARSVRAASLPVGHHLNRPFDRRLVASQNPWPS